MLEVAALLPTNASGQKLPIHALTATATRQVQQEITTTPGMGRENVGGRVLSVRTGNFVRDNLVFRVYPVTKREERDTLALGIVHQLVHDEVRGGASIVYVATSKTATQFARLLRNRNIAAQAYHGGLPTPERHHVQERFMQGELDVVVATNAFGMGVNKAEIRFVLHYDHPASLESYAQEAGCGRRDGKEAYAILLYHFQMQSTERFIARQGLSDSKVLRAYQRALLALNNEVASAFQLADGTVLCDPDTLATLARIEPTQAHVLLFSFEEAGLVRRGPDCTLEATLLLNRPAAAVLSALSGDERALAARLFDALGAVQDRQVTYRAALVYEQTGIDPRAIDPLLVRLAERDLLLYRSYSRGMTLTLDARLSDIAYLQAIEQGFAGRHQRFEERLQAMLDYIKMRPGQSRCRSAALINYLTGRDDAPLCGKCGLCSPTSEHLPWDPGTRLYGEPLPVDMRLAVLGAVRDHNGYFAARTIEKMLLGIPQTNLKGGQVYLLSSAVRASDHFGELDGLGIKAERVQRTIEALIEGGFLQLSERTIRAKGISYTAVSITRRGRDALAGGVELPAFREVEALS